MSPHKNSIKGKIEEQPAMASVRRDRFRWLPGFFVLLLALFMAFFEHYFLPIQVPQQGKPSLQAIRAPYDFVFDEQKAIQEVAAQELRDFVPIFQHDSQKSRQVLAQWEDFFNGLEECRQVATISKRKAGNCLNDLFGVRLEGQVRSELLQYSHLSKIKDILTGSLKELLNKGVLLDRENLHGRSALHVRFSDRSPSALRALSDIKDLSEGTRILCDGVELLNISSLVREALCQKFGNLLEPNLYSVKENEELKAFIRAKHSKKKRILYRRGDLLLPQGEVATLLDILRVQDCLDKARPASILVGAGSFLPFFLITLIFVLISQRMAWTAGATSQSYLLLFFVVFSILMLAKALYLFTNITAYFMPISAGGVVIALLLDLPAALLAVLLMAIYTTFLTTLDMGLFIYYLIGGAVFVLWASRTNRIKLFFYSFLVGIINVVLLICIILLRDESLNETIFRELVPQAFLSALVAYVLALILTPLCEKLFGLTTADRLREFADLNHPLLKKMQEKAPGTYYHCLAVANLASVAAEVVNADVLLVRAGAYYHDIGKILQPEYFIENQNGRENLHDSLDPTTSYEIVKAHVQDGVATLREYRFPQALIDLVAEHHGTTVVEAIFTKAQKSHPDLYCNPDYFRYNGPKPHRIESAILMIADVVEAIGRVLKTTNPLEVKDAVHRVIVKKFDDGQFDQCGISTHLLAQIETALIQTLLRILHKRIDYPEGNSQKEKETTKNFFTKAKN